MEYFKFIYKCFKVYYFTFAVSYKTIPPPLFFLFIFHQEFYNSYFIFLKRQNFPLFALFHPLMPGLIIINVQA